MNILISAYYTAPSSGNFVGSLIDLGLKLRENGGKLFFVFPKSQSTTCENSWVQWLERAGFIVCLVDVSESNEKQLGFLKKIIKENKIDILHIHFDLFLNFAVHKREELPVKIIVHEHMEYPAGCNRVYQAMKYVRKSFIYRMKKIGIICVNRYVNMAHFGTKHWFIPNGLSLKRNILSKAEMAREECRDQLQIQDNEKFVMFLGWDLYRKGLDVAIRAVNECRKSNSNVVLGIVGLGTMPFPNPKGIDYIKKYTDVSPFENWIRFLPNTEDMFAYHRAADVYLSSSRSEAFSYGILEAISQNTPVVVSDIKGTSWCTKYSKSFMYPVEDYKKCADAIISAIDIENNLSNSKKICLEYSIDKWCDRIMEVYNNV